MYWQVLLGSGAFIIYFVLLFSDSKLVAFLRSKSKPPGKSESSGSNSAGGPQAVCYESSSFAAQTQASEDIPMEEKENQTALLGNHSPSY